MEEESRTLLREHYKRAPFEYEEALASAKLLKRFLWAKLQTTSDARSIQGLATILHTITVDYLRMVAMCQDVEDTIANAETLAKEARQELRDLKACMYGSSVALPTVEAKGSGRVVEGESSSDDGRGSDSANADVLLSSSVVPPSSSSSFSLRDGNSSNRDNDEVVLQSSESKASEVVESREAADSTNEGKFRITPSSFLYDASSVADASPSSASAVKGRSTDAVRDSFKDLLTALMSQVVKSMMRTAAL